MDQEHVISEQVLNEAQLAISRGSNWIAYNTIPYFLEKGDVYFFKQKQEAEEFSDNNIGEYNDYKIIQANSIATFQSQIQFDENPDLAKTGHVITDELFEKAQQEIGTGNYWIVFDKGKYLLDNQDMFFFSFEDEARTFAAELSPLSDGFGVIEARTTLSMMRQLPYGEPLNFNLSEPELEELFKSFDWTTASYDPLHDTIKAVTEEEKDDLSRMETLVTEWETLYHSDPEKALELAAKYWEGHPMESYKNDFLTINFDLMNEKNFDYLKSNVRNHGFGETLTPDLESALKAGQSDFTIAFKTEVNKREMEATLYFRRSNESDMYFFNKYDTRLKNEKNETISQTFYINNGWGVTLKEAYNLLNGRAVHKELSDKEGQKYQAWIQLDFNSKDKNGNYERKQYHQNYGYDLKEALSYYLIKEMSKEQDINNLVRSLERGNLQQVTIEAGGKETKVFIEANPHYKTINLYSSQMQRLDQEQRNEMMRTPGSGNDNGPTKERTTGQDQSTSMDNSQENNKKKANTEVKNDTQSQEKGRRNTGQKKGGEGLVEKKRNNTNRGMGI